MGNLILPSSEFARRLNPKRSGCSAQVELDWSDSVKEEKQFSILKGNVIVTT